MSDEMETPKTAIPTNGIDAESGGYLLSNVTPEILATVASGTPLNKQQLESLKEKRKTGPFAVGEGIDPNNLAQTGWGILFAHEDNERIPAIKEALGILLEHRKRQAGEYYRELTGKYAYRPGDTKIAYLQRHGIGFGPVDPARNGGIPYYILIVGDPATIPYQFQYEMDVPFAVGRIHFDTLDEYENYAKSVVAAETGEVKLERNATFFGVRNPDDPATTLGTDKLLIPLAGQMSTALPDWTSRQVVKEEATKSRLSQIMGGSETPTFLFTESHGMGFPNGHKNQIPHQGALLCQDWPGPREHRGPIPQDFYLAGDDIASDARLIGMMAFFFACYGAGTPEIDDFSKQTQRASIAPHPFLSSLPRRMLGHPKGGALATVGHVERAWGYSFMIDHYEEEKQKQLQVFEDLLKNLLKGHRLGNAFESFNQRYAEIGVSLNHVLEEMKYDKSISESRVAALWTTSHDARNYVVLGDPAVRLPFSDQATGGERVTLETVTLPARSGMPVDEVAISKAKQELTTAREAVEAAEQQLEAAKKRLQEAETEMLRIGGSL
jgi:hypothetical protein